MCLEISFLIVATAKLVLKLVLFVGKQPTAFSIKTDPAIDTTVRGWGRGDALRDMLLGIIGSVGPRVIRL